MTSKYRMRYSVKFVLLIHGMLVLLAPIFVDSAEVAAQAASVHFAVIGDFGNHAANAVNVNAVANLVKSWSPEFIITTGDNNYPSGAASTIDSNIGRYYHEFIYPYTGAFGAGATTNRFFPSLGNHDWQTANVVPYLNYFSLPGNERYYDFVWGPVHFFSIDAEPQEPDGRTSTSKQALWLRDRLAASNSPWKLVYMHQPPYSSAQHGSNTTLRWPYQEWGADAVLTGHDHTYERVLVNGFPYFVVGLGGRSIYNFRPTPVAGSMVRYNANYGAMVVDATASEIVYRFYSIAGGGTLIDTYAVIGEPVPLAPVGTTVANLNPTFTWSVYPNVLYYEIQLGTTNPPTTAPISVTSASYTPETPLLISTYYWRVRAVNTSNVVSPWSPIVNVTITSVPNAAPPLTFFQTATPTLSWNRVTGAGQYEVQVDSHPAFTSPLDHSVIVPATSLSITTPALADGVYYWRVRASDGSAFGAWSAVESFRVDVP